MLVYAHDPRDRAKQRQAVLVLGYLIESEQAFLSVQCLSEFYNVVMRRLSAYVPPAQALAHVEEFSVICRILDLTAAAVLEGCRAADTYQMHLWDALIWSVAMLNRVPVVLSEDMQHDRVIEGVRYLNPFLPDFNLAML